MLSVAILDPGPLLIQSNVVVGETRAISLIDPVTSAMGIFANWASRTIEASLLMVGQLTDVLAGRYVSQ
jgi:hypothetical protein